MGDGDLGVTWARKLSAAVSASLSRSGQAFHVKNFDYTACLKVASEP